MSANNYILIKEVGHERFLVGEKDVDTEGTIGKPLEVNDLREAIEKANKLQDKIGGTEYGLMVELLT